MDYEKLILKRNEDTGYNSYLGIEFTQIKDNFAQAEIEVEQKHLNPRGVVHGGCIFSLMDTAGGVAAITSGNLITTSSSHVTFLNPAACKRLIARATEIKVGKSLLVFDVEATDENGRLLAKGTFTYFRLKEKFVV